MFVIFLLLIGYVKLMELLQVPLLKWYKPHDILQEAASLTEAGHRRFEWKDENGFIYIRALYGRRMERVSKTSNLHITVILLNSLVLCNRLTKNLNFRKVYNICVLVHDKEYVQGQLWFSYFFPL